MLQWSREDDGRINTGLNLVSEPSFSFLWLPKTNKQTKVYFHKQWVGLFKQYGCYARFRSCKLYKLCTAYVHIKGIIVNSQFICLGELSIYLFSDDVLACKIKHQAQASVAISSLAFDDVAKRTIISEFEVRKMLYNDTYNNHTHVNNQT